MIKLFSTGEVANKLKKCRETINYYIKNGKLKPFAMVNGKAVFTEEEILRFEQQISPPGAIAA